ncbi:MAG: hypothetical protein H6729_06420 [Deltaproteobacteria bacterium]|nr:hypothetical protein [Deltaproteobacteria bacterium]
MLMIALGACSDSEDSPARDSGVADVGSGPVDSGSTDAWVADAGSVDAATTDADMADVATTDADVADAATTDADVADAATMDAEMADAMTMDADMADAMIMDADMADAMTMDADMADAMIMDADMADAMTMDADMADAQMADADIADAASSDGGPSDGGHYGCSQYSDDPEWLMAPGLRAVTVAAAAQGLSQPVALAFAEGDFGSLLYIVDQGNSTLFSFDLATGAVTPVVEGTGWARAPTMLTTIVWDRYNTIDGRLYVGDKGNDGDGDSVIFRVLPSGETSVFVEGPAPGLDDVYGLAFAPPGGAYAEGLYVAGDTVGTGVDWGRVDASGVVHAFSEVAGVDGMVFDDIGQFGGYLIATRPSDGHVGDGTVTVVLPDGSAGPALGTDLPGAHAITVGPSSGFFGRDLYAASWSDEAIGRFKPGPVVEVVALGLTLSPENGNILALSPDGEVLFVADREASRIVCIEPTP